MSVFVAQIYAKLVLWQVADTIAHLPMHSLPEPVQTLSSWCGLAMQN